ncbi:nucleic acid/nucleotide deaminase domain-containing protein [Actinopolymorpha sp. B9G3]|uniref:nucleic acid/nucleotide deaminase domain-containing protein n=1 Tax=Actinopolymorpha sp. B9G3 TaxID=3158970 RepID=UPI0032D94EE0
MTVTTASVSSFKNSPKVAIFEFRNQVGNLIQVKDSGGNPMSEKHLSDIDGQSVIGKHAEELIEMMLDHLGVNSQAVNRIHSELDFCTLPGHNCGPRVQSKFAGATKTSCYRYGTAEERSAAERNLRNDTAYFTKVLGSASLLFNQASRATYAEVLTELFNEFTSPTLGGVDFSTLELRYLSEQPGGDKGRVMYVFSVVPGQDARKSGPLEGVHHADEASDAFMVWLALRPETFTVNLNPNEPDRIIDKDFGRTNAGRVLLEADLRLKKTVAGLIHPKRPLGKAFWAQLQGPDRCVSIRQWIVPDQATVRDTGDELYILDAPLQVLAETLYLKKRGNRHYDSCPGQPQAATDHNEALFRRMVLPHVERTVNAAPDYAALRRVYLSRVAAEWVRDRHGYQRTAYDNLIDSGRIDRWRLRVNWTPQDTFRRYVHSYEHGEFQVAIPGPGGSAPTKAYVFGGVDLTNVPSRNVGDVEFRRRWPDTAQAMRKAASEPTFDESTRRLLVGGQTVFQQTSPGSSTDENQHRDAPPQLPAGVFIALAVGLGFVLLLALLFVRTARRR